MQCIESTKSFSATTTTLAYNILTTKSISESGSYLDSSSEEESPETVLCVWRRAKLSPVDFVVYAFVVPSLAFFGLCANFINAIVFMRPKMTPSAFTYLAALSWLDCVSCLLITLTAISRSFLYSSTFWMAYDFQWQTPLFGISTGAANLILACVSLDRFIYLRWGIPMNGTPKFCRNVVAKQMIAMALLIAVVVNLPYFFVFVVNKDGSFVATDFYFSKYYMIHNWFTFVLLALLPAIFLVVGNAAILIAFCSWTKQSKICEQANPNSSRTRNRYKHQMKLTITILIVITLYLIGELPAHLTSRKSAVNLLYGGDVSKVNFETMQRLEVICITLNAVQLSLNIIVYAVINPSFMPEFFTCLRGASDVCFRFMGITCLTKHCGQLCKPGLKTHKHKATDESESDNNNHISEIDWTYEAQGISVNENANIKPHLEIAVITPTCLKRSFDNPTFTIEKK